MLITKFKHLFIVSLLSSILFSFNSFAESIITAEEPYFDCEVSIIVDGKYVNNSRLAENTKYVLTDVVVWEDLSKLDIVYTTLTKNSEVLVVDTSDDDAYCKIKIDDNYYYTISKALGTKEDLDKINNTASQSKYPTAAYIWNYLINDGYSEAAAAGILGNMMVEVGGWVGDIATFNLDVTNNGRVYYGLCQWKKSIYPKVVGMNLEQQLNFLNSTIAIEYRDFGRLGGYSLEAFKSGTDPESLALSFAKTYERCSSKSYARRQRCARVAYNEFA